jgi:hypothetical protein
LSLPGLDTSVGAVGIPIAKTVYEHLLVLDSETLEAVCGDRRRRIRRPRSARVAYVRLSVATRTCELSICTLSCPHDAQHSASERLTSAENTNVGDVYLGHDLTMPE